MKLLRYGPRGQEKPGLLDREGRIRDLSPHVADLGPAELSPEGLAKLAALDPETLPPVEGSRATARPSPASRKFIAIGLNYADHAAESGLPIPTEPVVFTKAISCIQGPNDPIVIPRGSVKTDWEVELGVVIGTRALLCRGGRRAATTSPAIASINDVSERDYQIERGGTWDKGKGCDTFGPLGPWLVTADEVGDPQASPCGSRSTASACRTAAPRTMIFGVAKLVSYRQRSS